MDHVKNHVKSGISRCAGNYDGAVQSSESNPSNVSIWFILGKVCCGSYHTGVGVQSRPAMRFFDFQSTISQFNAVVDRFDVT
jgi:hypothetical protein